MPTTERGPLDRGAERKRAVRLARHYREAEGLPIAHIAQRLDRDPATIKGYFYDPHWREGPSGQGPLPRDMPRLRRSNHRPRRQGRRLRVLQELPSRSDRAHADARLGARRDARMAPAIREAALVNRLVSDARPQTWRRGAGAVPSSRLAGAVDRHRHLRVLACSSYRRVPRRLTDSVGRRAHPPRRPVPTKRGAWPAFASQPSDPRRHGGRRLARAVARQPHLPARAARQRSS